MRGQNGVLDFYEVVNLTIYTPSSPPFPKRVIDWDPSPPHVLSTSPFLLLRSNFDESIKEHQ